MPTREEDKGERRTGTPGNCIIKENPASQY
jgi:hypothetical protein